MAAPGERAAQDAWVRRVLGAALATAQAEVSSGARSSDQSPAVQWRDAREEVGAQIARLQDAMRGTDHPVLKRIADRGLNAITGRLQVGLQVALMELDRPDAGGAAQTARAALADMRGFLQSDRIVPLLEANPLGVAVSIRAPLTAAIEAIERRL